MRKQLERNITHTPLTQQSQQTSLEASSYSSLRQYRSDGCEQRKVTMSLREGSPIAHSHDRLGTATWGLWTLVTTSPLEQLRKLHLLAQHVLWSSRPRHSYTKNFSLILKEGLLFRILLVVAVAAVSGIRDECGWLGRDHWCTEIARI